MVACAISRLRRKSGHVLVLAGLLIFLAMIPLRAENYTVFNLQNFSPLELRYQPFAVTSAGEFQISIIGSRFRDTDQMFSYGWILDSKTREVIWSLTDESTRRYNDDKMLRSFDGTVDLDEGDYEAYFYSGNPFMIWNIRNIDGTIEGFKGALELLGKAFDESFSRDMEDYKRLSKKNMFALASESKNFVLRDNKPPQLPNQVLSIVRPKDLTEETKGFKVSEKLDLLIYAIGEYSEGSDVFVDGARIINAATRQKVWAMERWNTDWAGGAAKNRVFFDDIEISPGDYILDYWTDDSHAFDKWNDSPPNDPYFYGITLAVTAPQYMKLIAPFDAEKRRKALVQIVRVGDDADEARQFKLKKDLKINIYAIGEGRDGYMYDYGGIESARDSSLVWIMKESETEHAGGSSKNRMYDGIIDLKKGDYILFYKTDGSHSYDAWNAAQPSDPRHYGITLYAYGEDVDTNVVEVTSISSQPIRRIVISDGKTQKTVVVSPGISRPPEEPAPPRKPTIPQNPSKPSETKPGFSKYLVRMTKLGDDADDSAIFRLNQPSRVRIYATGEGVRGEMFDYGWIQNVETGSIVWEMTYRKTTPAGGAAKNRMVNDVIMLDKGTYKVFFVTDDSHSYDSWNDDEPDDPESWGITIGLDEQ